MGPVFHERGEFFNVVLMDGVSWQHPANMHVTKAFYYQTFHKYSKVRPWKKLMPKIISLDNAYRPRKGEEDLIPHSFLFRRRD